MAEPFVWTFAEFLELCEVERLAAFRTETEHLALARLIAFAVHEPKRLAEESNDLTRRLRDAGEVKAVDERDRVKFIARVVRRAERRHGH